MFSGPLLSIVQFFASLPLPCIIVNANGRYGGGLGTRLQMDLENALREQLYLQA